MNRIYPISVIQFTKIQAVLGTMLGLVLGIFYSVGGLFVDILVTLGLFDGDYWGTPGLSHGSLMAFGALLGMPLIFGTIGFFWGLLSTPVYNALAKRFPQFRI